MDTWASGSHAASGPLAGPSSSAASNPGRPLHSVSAVLRLQAARHLHDGEIGGAGRLTLDDHRQGLLDSFHDLRLRALGDGADFTEIESALLAVGRVDEHLVELVAADEKVVPRRG